MSEVFNPEVKVSEQALARKERFRKYKEAESFDHEQTPLKDQIPRIYFDDLGTITAVTYDDDFEPDSTWKTYDFDPTILKMIKNKGTSRYVITRLPSDGATKYAIEVRNKYNTHRELTIDTTLVHIKKLRTDTEVDIVVKVTDQTLEFELTDAGLENIKNSDVSSIKVHITEPMNPHALYEVIDVDLIELAKGPVTIESKSNCDFKSLYAQRPFAYGRV